MSLRLTSRHAFGSLVTLAFTFVACSGATESVGSKYVKTASIGPEGGAISISAKDDVALAGTSITIPPHALAVSTTISIGLAAQEGVAPSGTTAVSPVLDFEPSGTVFASPVTITIPVTVGAGTVAASVSVEAVEPGTTTGAISVQSLANGLATFQTSGLALFGAWTGGNTCTTAPNPGDLCASNADCACLAGSSCVSGHCASGGTTVAGDAGCPAAPNPGDLCSTTADCACLPGSTCVSGHCDSGGTTVAGDAGTGASDAGSGTINPGDLCASNADCPTGMTCLSGHCGS